MNMMKAALVTAVLATVTVIVISACAPAPASPPTAPAAPATTVVSNYPAPSFITSRDCESLRYAMLPLANLTISSGGATDITVQVEVAGESGQRAQGLMCREVIPLGTGMLFTYDIDWDTGFWMFNTYAPIDILYLDQAGRVVDKISMSPCPRGSANGLEADDIWSNRCKTEALDYVPSGKWRNTLELPAGWLETQGLNDPLGKDVTISWTTSNP